MLSHSDAPLEDAVELFNASEQAVDIGGWYLSDNREDSASLRKYRIPEGVVLAAGGYHVIYENAFGRGEGLPGSFALNSSGDEVFLSSADPETGELTGYISGVSFDALDPGVSWGRLATSEGVDYGALQERSFGEDSPASLEQFRAGGGAEGLPVLATGAS